MSRHGRRVVISVEEIQRFLASDAGRRYRRAVGAGIAITAPLLFKIPGFRRHPLLRWVEVLGGVALVVRLAEALRDWEPAASRPIVLEVPPERPDRKRRAGGVRRAWTG